MQNSFTLVGKVVEPKVKKTKQGKSYLIIEAESKWGFRDTDKGIFSIFYMPQDDKRVESLSKIIAKDRLVFISGFIKTMKAEKSTFEHILLVANNIQVLGYNPSMPKQPPKQENNPTDKPKKEEESGFPEITYGEEGEN